MMTGAILTSRDLLATRTEIVKWLREFGLESGVRLIFCVVDHNARGSVRFDHRCFWQVLLPGSKSRTTAS